MKTGRQTLKRGIRLNPWLLFLLMTISSLGRLGAAASIDTTQPSAGVVRSAVAVVWNPSDSLAGVPQPELIELKLAHWGIFRLVDRSAIASVLKEQQLAAALGPSDGSNRIKLGRLLKADFLVILRSSGDVSARKMEITVCETHGGLRIATERIPLGTDPEQDAAAAVKLIQPALERGTAGITTIFAVPPFQNLDLEQTFDSMQDAYALVIQQSLLSHKGVLVVELAEAQAISQELALSNDQAVHRRAPIYVVGEFRHGTGTKSPTITITLKCTQAGNDLLPPRSQTVGNGSVPELLLAASENIFSASRRTANPATTPAAEEEQLPTEAKREAALLDERGEAFALVGDWERALPLLEASLLVQPNQPWVHAAAFKVLGHLPLGLDHYYRTLPGWGDKDQWDSANTAAIVGFRARQIDHLEAFLRSTIPCDTYKHYGPCFKIIRASQWEYHTHVRDLAAQDLALRRRQRDMFFDVFEAKVRAHATDAYACGLWGRELGQFLYPQETLEEKVQTKLRAIKLFKDAPIAGKGENIIYVICRYDELRGMKGLPWPQLDRLLTAAEALNSPNVSTIVARIRAEGPDFKMHFSTFRYVPPPAAQDTAAYRPLNLTFRDSNGLALANHAQIFDWKPAGKGADVAIGRDALFVMTEKDVLQQIYKADTNAFDFSQICFDGKYVWAPVVQADPSVLIIDPLAGKVVAKLTAANGVPAMNIRAVAAAISPGHACLSGGFGRGWIAWASFDPTSGPTFKVFWEARDETGNAMTDPHFAFSPLYAVTLEGKSSDTNGAAVQRVILEGVAKTGMPLPLIIDPVSSSVTVLSTGGAPFGHPATELFADGDSLYWIDLSQGYSSGRLVQWGLPDFKARTLAPSVPGCGPMAFYDGKLNVAGGLGQWITSRNPAGPYVILGGDMPGRLAFRRICISNFYGLLLIPDERQHDLGVYAVQLPPDVLMKHSADPEETARRMTMSDVAAALKAADDHYAQELQRARELLITRMAHAKEFARRPGQAEAIDKACQALMLLKPGPEIGEHHAETLPAAPGADFLKMGLADACEDVICFDADLELAHKRWMGAVALMIQSPGTMMADDLARASATGDLAQISKIKSMLERLEEAKRGIPTTWYREAIKDHDPGKPPARSAPLAQVIHDVHLSSARVGGGLNFPFEVRTLIAPFRSGEAMASGTIEQIFQGDEMVYAAMDLPAGNRGQVGDERFIGAATYKNMLSAGSGGLWHFSKPGQYTLKLIVINGDGWNDVLDAYEEPFTVGPAS